MYFAHVHCILYIWTHSESTIEIIVTKGELAQKLAISFSSATMISTLNNNYLNITLFV